MREDPLFRFYDLKKEDFPLDESFPDDRLIALVQSDVSWYDDVANFLAARVLPLDMDYQFKKKFFHDLKQYN